MKKIILALPLLLAIGGCNGRGGSASPDLDMMAEANASAPLTKVDAHPRAISIDSALAHLPEGAGLPKAARDRHYRNGYAQEIILASDAPSAESRIEITIQNGKPLASPDKAPVWKPGESGIRQELARYFPHMRMQVVANGGYENQYGRFGVAIGRRGESLRCVYAWQYIDDARRSFAEGHRIKLDEASAAPAALRVQLCRADVTVDELVGFVSKLSVVIPDDFGAAAAVGAQSGLRQLAAAPPRTQKKARPRRVKAARAVLERAEFAPAPAPYQAAETGARYLAPVDAPARGVNPDGRGGLNASLPPQAYRGPAGAATAAGAPSVIPMNGVADRSY